MTLSKTQQDLLSQLGTNIDTGLTKDQVSERREAATSFNVIDPPIKCPAWVCCLLPCIKSIPSMKAFREVQPDDAEILRESRWTRYDAASCVTGDIVRLAEGDIVPADCVVLTLQDDEMLVDVRNITGESKVRSIKPAGDDAPAVKLFYGGHVLQGSAMCVVTAVGSSTLLAKLIRKKKFPPKDLVDLEEDSEEDSIALVSRKDIV
jgi:magnesium-transporting ATPase (P-type)